jgi:hypothetical protein
MYAIAVLTEWDEFVTWLAENIRFDAKPAYFLMEEICWMATLQEIGFVYQAIGS